VNFINEYKKAIANTPLSTVPIGHVDTWDVWGNATNKPVLDAVDWIGVDEYPYYENGKNNTIQNSGYLFDDAYNAAVATAGDKEVWVTETGWPVSGVNWDLGVPSLANAKYYWDEVGCRKLFNKVPTFWYTLEDTNSANKQLFAITDNLSTTPAFDLTCPTTFETQDDPSSSVSSGTASTTAKPTSTKSGSSATGVTSPTAGIDSGSGSSTGSSSGTPTGSAASATSSGAAPVQMANAAYAGVAFIAGALALV